MASGRIFVLYRVDLGGRSFIKIGDQKFSPIWNRMLILIVRWTLGVLESFRSFGYPTPESDLLITDSGSKLFFAIW